MSDNLIQQMKRCDAREMMETLAEAHGKLVERELERILDKHSMKLSDDGVQLLMFPHPDDPLQIIYELRKHGVLLETFGFEMDLTNPI